MLFHIFVIAVTLTLSNGESVNETTCFYDTGVKVAAIEFSKNFHNVLQSGWKPETGHTLKSSYDHFLSLAAKACNESTANRSTDHFLHLLKHAFTSDYLPDFLENGIGRSCVSTLQNKIKDCVNKNVVMDIDHLNDSLEVVTTFLWASSKFTHNAISCNITLKVKKCTMDIINNNAYCKKIGNFVDDLFEGVYKNCAGLDKGKNTKEIPQRHVNSKPKSASNNGMVIFLVVIAILVTLYVLIRDWKFNRLPCVPRHRTSRAENVPLNDTDRNNRNRPLY